MALRAAVQQCFEQTPRFDSLGEDSAHLSDVLATVVVEQCRRQYGWVSEKHV